MKFAIILFPLAALQGCASVSAAWETTTQLLNPAKKACIEAGNQWVETGKTQALATDKYGVIPVEVTHYACKKGEQK